MNAGTPLVRLAGNRGVAAERRGLLPNCCHIHYMCRFTGASAGSRDGIVAAADVVGAHIRTTVTDVGLL
jgi:hypothetical protein